MCVWDTWKREEEISEKVSECIVGEKYGQHFSTKVEESKRRKKLIMKTLLVVMICAKIKKSGMPNYMIIFGQLRLSLRRVIETGSRVLSIERLSLENCFLLLLLLLPNNCLVRLAL